MKKIKLPGAAIKSMHASVDAADIFAEIHNLPFAAFLDSSLKGEKGRFSIIGLNPYLVLERREGTCFYNGKAHSDSFENTLRCELAKRQTNPTALPFTQGALGYFSYDYGRSLEQVSSRHQATIPLPEARMVFYHNFIIEDAVNHSLFLVASQHDTAKTAYSLDELERLVLGAQKLPTPRKSVVQTHFDSPFSCHEYMDAVERLVCYMRRGHTYVTNLTQQLSVQSSACAYEVYRYLRTYNAASFSAFLNYPDVRVVCSSPERFMKIRGRNVETSPIKGTRPRKTNAPEDKQFRHALEKSGKDLSELMMTVDLERNDLNRICIPGSVKVTNHASVEEYATVFHLASTICGRMAEDKDIVDLISATFPGGSITGAPKIRAMEIIDELERNQRGLYTGSIGYLAADGNCDLNIVIRTALEYRGTYYLGVGGGITHESDARFEYEETLLKGEALLEAISAAETGLTAAICTKRTGGVLL